VVFAGMNDTLRSDFDAGRLHNDPGHGRVHTPPIWVRWSLPCGTTITGRVFRLPGPLRRALADRIATLNGVVDTVALAAPGRSGGPGRTARYVSARDVERRPAAPVRTGAHRMLAGALADTFAAAGVVVVGTGCHRSAPAAALDQPGRPAGLVGGQGIPWLWRRGQDLVPYAIGVLVNAAIKPTPAQPAQPDEILARRRGVGQRTS